MIALRFAVTLVLGASLGVAACGGDSSGLAATTPVQPTQPTLPAADTTPLRSLAAKRGLLIGSAIDRGFRYAGNDGVQFKATMARQFNVLTPENDMKHDHIHPGQNVYRFEPADSLVTFAESNGMEVRGHTLVWYQQLASWLTTGTWTADQATALLNDHIAAVVGHYRGHVMEWDVVNEALNDDGSLRSTFWSTHIGRGYIEQAFRAARAADSTVGLFYNDYNIEGLGAKSDSVYAMVVDFQKRGVPITGVGLQAHFQVGGIPSTLGANIARFAALGLKVHITELDIRVPTPSTAASLQTQATNYHDVVQTCISFPACDVVVMWGFTDKESWVPGTFPGWGEALIFDAAYQPKPAFTALQTLLK